MSPGTIVPRIRISAASSIPSAWRVTTDIRAGRWRTPATVRGSRCLFLKGSTASGAMARDRRTSRRSRPAISTRAAGPSPIPRASTAIVSSRHACSVISSPTSSPLPFQIRRYEHAPFSYTPGKALARLLPAFRSRAGNGARRQVRDRERRISVAQVGVFSAERDDVRHLPRSARHPSRREGRATLRGGVRWLP